MMQGSGTLKPMEVRAAKPAEDIRGVLLPRRRRVAYGEGGSVKTREIELSKHEVLA